LSPYKRFFVRHEMTFRAHYSHGQPVPFWSDDDRADVVTVLTRAMKADTAKFELKNKDVIRLTKLDLLEDIEVAALLFRRTDADASTQMYEHQKTRKLRRADKLKRTMWRSLRICSLTFARSACLCQPTT
jgi:hypothetical protein